MGKICTIICGAPCGKFPRELAEGFIIAADRGLDYALEAGISPDIAVGDFDSAKSAVPSGIETVKFPPEKDYSDAELAANIALTKSSCCVRSAAGSTTQLQIFSLHTA